MFIEPKRVPPQMRPGAKIALVGQSPGNEELKHGRPFYERAPAGGLLTQCLNFAYIQRSTCHITNLFKEHPPGGNISKWLSISEKGVVNETPKYHEALQELEAELREISPNVIVALGKEATYALVGTPDLGKWRGSVLESSLIPGQKVIPSWHPAGCLVSRNYLGRFALVADLRKTKYQGEFPGVNLRERTLEIAKTIDDVHRWTDDISKRKIPFAFDIEVLNRQVSCISLSYNYSFAICIPFVHEGHKSYWTESDEAFVWRSLSDILSNPEIPKMGQNLLFDISFLAWMNNIITRGPILDTMIAQALLYPDLAKGLDFLCSIHTDVPYYKDEGKFWKTSQIKNWKQGWEYNAKDSVVIPEIWPKLEKELQAKKMMETYNRVVSTFPALTFMMIKGIKVNRTEMAAYSQSLEESYNTLAEELKEICGFDLNPNSHKQVSTYFYIYKKLKPYTKRGGSITTDDTAMLRIERKGFREAEIIRWMRKIKKLKGTYLDISLDEDDRLRSSINPVGATTGRISTSKNIFGNGMNTQNQPPESRVFLVPDDNHLLAGHDLSQAEAMVVAYVSRDPNMMKVFKHPNPQKGDPESDIHALTAKLFEERGLPISRPLAKEINHASNYGMGPGTLSLSLTDAGFPTTEKEAKVYIGLYHSVYPSVRSVYHKSIESELRRNSTVYNLLGRRRYFQRPQNDDLLRKAYDYKAQSTVADVINEAVNRAYTLWAWIADFLAQVHDELLTQIPLMELHSMSTVLWGLKNALEMPLSIHGETFTIPSGIKVGLNWRDMEELDAGSLKGLVDSLSGVYRRHGMPDTLPHLDSFRRDLRGPSEKGLS